MFGMAMFGLVRIADDSIPSNSATYRLVTGLAIFFRALVGDWVDNMTRRDSRVRDLN